MSKARRLSGLVDEFDAEKLAVRAVNRGGTGVSTIADLLTALQTAGAFGKSNILGTVSQLAGVPTGALIESGSNANGSYVRYADGTQICWKNFVSGPVAFSAGPIYTSASASAGSFPIAFVAGTTPRVVASGYAGTGGWPAPYAAPSATSWGNWAMYKEVVQSTGSTVMDLIAIGRWF